MNTSRPPLPQSGPATPQAQAAAASHTWLPPEQQLGLEQAPNPSLALDLRPPESESAGLDLEWVFFFFF